jgi:glycosyltransferase involved in cell wall biosynthesis
MKVNLSVIMPVYNEISTIEEIIGRVRREPAVREVIVVDDFSTDGTRKYLKSIRGSERSELGGNSLKLIFHEKNMGKGAAIRSALREVTGNVVIIQDADLEYDPREYPKLLAPILDDRADVVYGSRFLGGPHRVLYFWHYVGNKVVTIFSNIMTNLNLSDMETCYKVFRAEVIKDVTLRSDRFGFEPEFTIKVAKKKWRVYEVPISYSGRTYEEGKKITWRDGIMALWYITWYRWFD